MKDKEYFFSTVKRPRSYLRRKIEKSFLLLIVETSKRVESC